LICGIKLALSVITYFITVYRENLNEKQAYCYCYHEVKLRQDCSYRFKLEDKHLANNNNKQSGRSHPKKSTFYQTGHLTKKAVIAVSLMLLVSVGFFALLSSGNQASTLDGDTEPTPTIKSTPTPTSTPSPATQKPIKPTVNPTPRPVNPTTNPTPNQPQDTSHMVVTNANPVNAETWHAVAEYAWGYFAPDIGVDLRTGLPGSSGSVYAFTDWDLGVYIQAVIDAQTTGLIDRDGEWGSSARLEKVMTFLETRELNATTGYPFWFYTNEGTNYHENSDNATGVVDLADTGRLLIALNNMKTYNTSLTIRIDNFVYNTNGDRSNYAAFVPILAAEAQVSNSIYSYYCISGFASFWPDELSYAPAAILNNMLASGNVFYGNITLPRAKLTGEPLYCAIFEIENNPAQLYTIAQEVYNAHEAYYNATGLYRAFSEGSTLTGDWAYEWVVYDDQVWAVKINNDDSDMTPLIYTKTAFSFLALYNTTFARNMVSFLENQLEVPAIGYYSGIDENDNKLSNTGLHTNGVILAAARYAYQHAQ